MESDNKQNFSEEDIKIIFGSGPAAPPPVVEFKPAPAPKPRQTGKIFQNVNLNLWAINILKFAGVFVVLFLISFTILNFPALWTKFRYYWQVEKNNRPWTSNQNVPPTATIANRLVVPKIGVNAPILWEITDEEMLNALERGVAHYRNTALPGETGNVFFTGHSSYYLWAGGSYKQIFALLDKLEIGDRIYINYLNVVFTYEVSSKKVVMPDDLSVLAQDSNKTLSLMTCVPVGTNLKRLVVVAKQIGT